MMTATAIRQAFLDFFQSKGHLIVPSAPIVVKNDPTLMFTNAGMNQFKDFFLGNKVPPATKIADTQKCLRVSGKHNDLEEVGVDTYHHTMFEMLGNWSFGDYFKKEAIAWSWELLTEIYKIPKENLYVTVFEGDEKEQLPASKIALTEWKKLVPDDKIVFGNKKDNFWEMGDTGPCGPCSEIHVDCRPDEERLLIPGRDLVNKDHPQVIEIWNNVFIQYNRKKDGSLEPLPSTHVDTGMGFERLVRVLQNKNSNYDTDIFSGTISATEAIVNKKYTAKDDKESIAFRVIADHIRAIGFAIADGQLPSNNGAGYVIRRILRRAVRYYYSYLGYKQPLLYQLMPVIAKQFEHVFPELNAQLDFVSKVIKEEEEAFLRTLEKGLKRMDDIIKENRDTLNQPELTNEAKLDGKAIFELYDTFGFPLDLTMLIASEHNLSVDEVGFELEMQQQKYRSRSAGIVDAQDWIILEDKPVTFVGYEDLTTTTKVLKYRSVKAKGKEQYQLVLETTPFYAESGGQVGDTGTLYFGDETIAVTDTKKENDLIIQFTDTLPTAISMPVKAVVDAAKRLNTAGNHTATHLMHAALRSVLGNHVHQKGSLVNSEYLRFDFSHFTKLTDEEIKEVEQIVNNKIRENIKVEIVSLPKEEALKIGAMALFGEKYADVVRVVTIDPAFSVELCGGTHVFYTGMIGTFKIITEAATAAGVRRIEAITGIAAQNFVFDQLKDIKEIAAILKTSDPIKSLKQLVDENHDLKKRIESFEAKQLAITKKEILKKVEQINGVNFIGEIVEVNNADALKKLCFDLKSDLTDYAVVLAANIEGKASVAILLDEGVASSKNLDAGKLIKEIISPLIKGGGGGQKTLATAGGQDVSGFKKLILKIKELI